jgi:hypothetical protein
VGSEMCIRDSLTPSTATTGAITLAGTLNVANGGTGVTTSTGTGSVVLSNSPTLVTPALGAATATSITLTKLALTVDSPFYTGGNISSGANNLGIGTTGASIFGVFTNNTERMRVTTNGDVLINTTASLYGFASNPSLELNGAAGAVLGLKVGGVAGSYIQHSGDLTIANTTANNMRLFTNNTERMRITSAGFVGIGTTAPTYNLEVVGSGNVSTLIRTTGGGVPVIRLTSDGVGEQNIYANVGSVQNMTFHVASSERMRIDSSGNVGIGTTSPANKLQVNGANVGIRLSDTSGTTDFHEIQSGGVNGQNLFIDADRNNVGSGNMIFRVAGATERMRIDSSGNVGIGTTPSVRLDVNNGAASVEQWIRTGTGFSSTLFLKPNGSGGGLRFQAEAGETATIYNTLNSPLAFGTNNTERFRILSTGGITSADLADAVGYKGVPQNSQTASYTLALSDIGKHISITTGGVVIPANGSVAFPIGATVAVYNNSASNQTISITTDTMYLAGTATTGSRTLAQRGLATCVKVAATTWVISGAGLT